MVSRDRVDLSALAQITELADYTIAFTLRAVAKTDIADVLADGPLPLDELAARTNTHAPSILRALRALISRNIFAEPQPQVFALTPMADLLRADHPLSMKYAFRTEPDLAAWAGMEYTLRTGKPSFEEHFGCTYWEHLARAPQDRQEFLASQSAMSNVEFLLIVRCHDWSKVATLVDLGGNDGSFSAAMMERYPGLHATVADLPGTVDAAAVTFSQRGLSDRGTATACNILTDPLPAGADTYTIKRVLIGFSDAEVTQLGHQVAAAMRRDSELVILEPRASGDAMDAAMDLHMLILGTGHVRTPETFAELLKPAGLRMARSRDARMVNLIRMVKAGD